MINLLKTHSFFVTKTIESCTLLEHQGYCNENYLVLAEGKKYIARKLLRDDIDRVFEYKVQLLAFEQGITAEPLVFDEENGFMVFEFLEGKHRGVETSVPHKFKSKSASETKVFTSKNDLKLLAKTLQKLHSIKIDAKLIKIDIENKTDEVLSAFETIDNYPKEYVLCHNDLNPQNIFFSKVAKLIDWEYAGVNDKYFDLACVCVEFKLNEKEVDVFLRNYRADLMIVREKLEAYKTIYIALCKQWFEEENLILPSQT